MKSITFVLLLALGICSVGAQDIDTNGMVRIAKFVISAPVPGTYVPWEYDRCLSGAIITINHSSFHYTAFTDVLVDTNSHDFSGPLLLFKDHIYLNNTNVPDRYRVAGIADGRPILITRNGYRELKETGKVFVSNILYIEKTPKSKTNSP